MIIFTDGAAKGNPGPGGWGAIIASDKDVRELGGGEAHTTNNRMELQAAFEALRIAREWKSTETTVYADSSYVINGATLWGSAWKKRGWITKDKKPVLNRDIWEPFLDLVESFGNSLTWQNVGGHVGVPGNERVDAIASGFALGTQPALYAGSRMLYRVNLTDVAGNAEMIEARSASRARARQKAYSYVSAVDGHIQVHATWAECEQRVRGKKAKFKKALSPAEEAEIIERFKA